MTVDPVDLINTPQHLLAWFRCDECGTRQERDRRLPAGAECERCASPLHTSDRFAYAPLRARLIAIAIDVAVIGLPFFLLGGDALLFGDLSVDGNASPREERQLVGVVVLCYLAVWQMAGTSPGKLALQLRVVDERTWRRPGIVTGILRAGMMVATIATLGIGYVNLNSDPERRTLHDRLAGTRVIQN